MLTEDFISKQIKNISIEEIEEEFNLLKQIGNKASEMSSRCRKGNNIVDFFTFTERLRTKGKYDIHFYDFVLKIEEFKQKKFIQNMLYYYETVKNKNKTKNQYVVYKEVYNICISAINIFRPLMAMEIYAKFKPKRILDFTCGWGGRLVGACALNIPYYIGIDINKNLEKPYEEMKKFLNKFSDTKIDLRIENSVNTDYSQLEYDMVFTSPPYFFLEKYSHNELYNQSKREMIDHFYVPLFKNTFEHLQKNGHFCLNINEEIYDSVCIALFGNADEVIPLKKSSRQNKYMECIYVWIKK
jgi:tRNA1(Val) A37 N6-methylase TrmN6